MIGQRGGLGRRIRRDENSSLPSAQPATLLSLFDEEEVREQGLDLDALRRVHWSGDGGGRGGEEKEGQTAVSEREEKADSVVTASDPGATVTTEYYYYHQPVRTPIKRSRPSLSPAVAKLTAQLNEAKDRLRRLRLLEGQGNDQQDQLDELIKKWRGAVEAVLEELVARTGASKRAILRSVEVDWTAKAFDWLVAGDEADDDDDGVGQMIKRQGRSGESGEDGQEHECEHRDEDRDEEDGSREDKGTGFRRRDSQYGRVDD